MKTGNVFRSKDKTGSFADVRMYVDRISEKTGRLHVLFEDGYVDWFSLAELNVDPASVREFNPDVDTDFLGHLL